MIRAELIYLLGDGIFHGAAVDDESPRMSITRVIIKQGDAVYRFLKFEGRPDGSLLVFLDRDPSRPADAMALLPDGRFAADTDSNSDKPMPHAKISCHTTGEIRYYSRGKWKTTFHIAPLYQLAGASTIAFFSIPRPARLDSYDRGRHEASALATLDLPQAISERMTFAIDLAPAATEHSITYGVVLTYELYSAAIRLLPAAPVAIPCELQEHFVYGVLRPEKATSRAIDKATAELNFHQAVHGKGPIVFREAAGSYLALTSVPMRAAPKLEMTFNRADLKAETIEPNEGNAPTHKVRFWICDGGGRNRIEDLRKHITSIVFDANI